MLKFTQKYLPILLLAVVLWIAKAQTPFKDSIAQRTQACTACHGDQDRAGPDGYYPRIASKPEGYLYNQLRNLRDGQRHYAVMQGLLAPLSDAYLLEIARYYSELKVPYPSPVRSDAPAAVMIRGQVLVTQGDKNRKLPACQQCQSPE